MNDTNAVNPEVEEFTQEEVNDSIFGSDSDQFFADLDREVNGSMLEPEQAIETEEVTQAPQEVGNPDSQETNNVDYEKRYKDSSREAQKLKSQLSEIEPFMPILNRLSEDEDMVEVVKDYLVNGKKEPAMELPEDFEFDLQDAIGNQNSDSAKYFNSLMDKAVSSKVNSILGQERQRTEAQKQQEKLENDALEFKQKTKMTDESFDELVNWAKEHKLSYDDLYYIKNRDRVQQNVSNATREDMLNQMQAVRNIPSSNANVNSQSAPKKDTNRSVLDALKGLDQGSDNLFG
tara:strand:- start:48 stop:917 length:870 start_codon:yes stop_codon:yes gene_type:complete